MNLMKWLLITGTLVFASSSLSAGDFADRDGDHRSPSPAPTPPSEVNPVVPLTNNLIAITWRYDHDATKPCCIFRVPGNPQLYVRNEKGDVTTAIVRLHPTEGPQILAWGITGKINLTKEGAWISWSNGTAWHQ